MNMNIHKQLWISVIRIMEIYKLIYGDLRIKMAIQNYEVLSPLELDFLLQIHWYLFLGVQLTMGHH